MARSLPKLENLMLKLYAMKPGSFADVAEGWASTYTDYAIDARSVLGSKPVTLGPSKAAMKATLLELFSHPTSIADTATKLANALAAFWPPVVFQNAFPGVYTAAGPPNVLAQAILAVLVSNRPDPRPIAAVMHTWTSTVIVTHPTTPAPTTGPIL